MIAPGRLVESDVEWVVNDNAELGVKIGDQLFFLWKGRSLAYANTMRDDGSRMRWRPVLKREFGECCRPPPLTWSDSPRPPVPSNGMRERYTWGDGWQGLPNANLAADIDPPALPEPPTSAIDVDPRGAQVFATATREQIRIIVAALAGFAPDERERIEIRPLYMKLIGR